MIQIRHTRKRRKRSTRKRSTQKGGQLWTPARNIIFTRRKNAANYARISKESAEKASQSIHKYLNDREEKQSDVHITEEEVVNLFMIDKQSLHDYINTVLLNATTLIEIIINKKTHKIMEEYGTALHNIILANHDMTRTKEATNHAAHERLSNSEPIVLSNWNKTKIHRGLENEQIKAHAEAIRRTLSSHQNDPHLRFLLMKELAKKIEEFNRIYFLRRSDEKGVEGLPASAKKYMRDPSTIPDLARQYYRKYHNGIMKSLERINLIVNVQDRAIPYASEAIMLLCVKASYAYLAQLKRGSAQYDAQKTECNTIVLTLRHMSHIHKLVLTAAYSTLGPELGSRQTKLFEDIKLIQLPYQ